MRVPKSPDPTKTRPNRRECTIAPARAADAAVNASEDAGALTDAEVEAPPGVELEFVDIGVKVGVGVKDETIKGAAEEERGCIMTKWA